MSQETHDGYTPTCELRWFRTTAVMFGDVPLAVTHDHESVSDYYQLKQKWACGYVGFEPEWRDIEVAL